MYVIIPYTLLMPPYACHLILAYVTHDYINQVARESETRVTLTSESFIYDMHESCLLWLAYETHDYINQVARESETRVTLTSESLCNTTIHISASADGDSHNVALYVILQQMQIHNVTLYVILQYTWFILGKR